jgi:antitoxin ParD1/3/4
MRTSKPLTVTLGHQQSILDVQLSSGTYASASEVLRAGLRALEREQNALDLLLKQKVHDAMADPRPDSDARDVFSRLRKHHQKSPTN